MVDLGYIKSRYLIPVFFRCYLFYSFLIHFCPTTINKILGPNNTLSLRLAGFQPVLSGTVTLNCYRALV